MHIQVFFERATTSFAVLGVLSMVLGFVLAFALALVTFKRAADGGRAFQDLTRFTGRGDSARPGVARRGRHRQDPVTSKPSLTDAAVLGMIVLIRRVLSITIEIEVAGVAPWRKALTSGAQILARTAPETARTEPGTDENP